jgi:hypothetical protein
MWPSSLLKLRSLSHLPADDGFVIAVRCAALAMVVIGIAVILPNFMKSGDSVALQAAVLSTIFIGLCGVVYCLVGFLVASMGRKSNFSDRRRQYWRVQPEGF